jgi:hypothetical protein
VEWTRFVEVETGRYNVMAVIENQNEDLASNEVSYTLSLFRDTEKIWESEGTTVVPAGKMFSVFEGPVIVSEVPTRATIDIGTPRWVKVEEAPEIDLVDSTFSTLESTPKLQTVLRSEDINPLSNIEVSVALYDDDNNTVHISRTVLDSIPARGEVSAFFTWPRPFGITPGVCAEPFASMMLIDRSGSMNEDGINPPEPLESVKNAALRFADQIGSDDTAGLVTFATGATLDVSPTKGNISLKRAIQDVAILPEDEEGYTNIGDALKIAREALEGVNISRNIVLLTDGKANWPLNPTGEVYAVSEATQVRNQGISLYAIGLGSSVGRDFLNELTNDPSKVFLAPTPQNLYSIYQEIGTRVCEREPFVVEVYTKRLNGEIRP